MAASEANIRVVESRGDGTTRVGKYHYIAALAQGGMADVYLAVMRGTIDIAKLVVVKEMRAELTADEDFVGMFLDEARLAARLNHPNVVQTYEVGNEGKRYFLAMEYLEGIPFVRILRMKERVPVPFAIHARILCDTLAGLHYAHELTDFDGTPLHVVHRDVSPQNILVTFGGGVKIVDFGIAKAAIAVERRAGDIKGKLAYMAPEQARTPNIDHRADVFCVGVMLWEAITRQRLWGPQGKPSIEQLLGEEIPDVRDIRPEVPARLAEICARALARHPDDRYSTAAEMEVDLEDYLSSTGQQTSTRDVGRFVAEKFAKDREALRGAVDGQLLRIQTQPPPDEERTMALPPLLIPQAGAGDYPSIPLAAASSSGAHHTVTSTSTSGVRRRDSERLEPGLPPPPLLPEPSTSAAAFVPPAPSAPSPRSGAATTYASFVLFVASVAMLAAAAVVFVRSRSAHTVVVATPIAPATATVTATATTTTATASTTAATPPGSTTSADPEPSAAPLVAANTEVELRVKASPSTAHVLIDGTPVTGNPFVGKRPRDGKMHVVRIEAPGYEPKSEEITFDKDLYMSIELHRGSGVGGGWQNAPRTGGAKSGGKPPSLDTDSPYK